MKTMFIVFFTMILTENLILVKFLGICAFLGVSKDLKSSVGMGMAVMIVITLSSIVTYGMHVLLLEPLQLGYLQIIVFILVIAALVQLIEFVLKKFFPTLHNRLGVYLPLITTNCAVLAVALLNITNQYSFEGSVFSSMDPVWSRFYAAIFTALGAGTGYLLAMVIFTGVRKMLLRCKPPKIFEGLPITLVAAAITSLSFTGFSGMIENLFK